MVAPFRYDRVFVVYKGAKGGGLKFPAAQTWRFTGRRVRLDFNWRAS